jgi:hypothetical protein
LFSVYEDIPKEVGDEKKYFYHVVCLCISFSPQFVYGCGGGAASGNYLENNQLNKANMPTRDGGFKCCEPFDLSHNVVSGNYAIGAKGCKDCHTKPSPFFNRKGLLDPFNRDGRPVYAEQWKILGYSRKRMKELTKERVLPPEAQKN